MMPNGQLTSYYKTYMNTIAVRPVQITTPRVESINKFQNCFLKVYQSVPKEAAKTREGTNTNRINFVSTPAASNAGSPIAPI